MALWSVAAMEHLFVAECEFASRLLSLRLDQAEDGMELPKLAASSLEHAVHQLEKARKHAVPEEQPVRVASAVARACSHCV